MTSEPTPTESGLTVRVLGRALDRHSPSHDGVPSGGEIKRAAVAAVVREHAATPELLFIRRAEHPRDPWSGHMAFPGGRVDAADRDPVATALRETREEVGLALDEHARQLGRLSPVQARGRRGRIPLVVDPFVFALEATPPALVLEPAEVQEALWVPLEFLFDTGNRQRMTIAGEGTSYELPCYRWEGRTIWGLTLFMLDELIGLVSGERPTDWRP